MLNVPCTLSSWSSLNGYVLPNIPALFLHLEGKPEESITSTPPRPVQEGSIHDLNCFYKQRMLTSQSVQATERLPPNSSSMILDDGCGLGTVTAVVKKAFPDLSVLAIDSSAGMLEVVNRKAKRYNWKNVVTRLLDGGDLTGTPISHHYLSAYNYAPTTVHPPHCDAYFYTEALSRSLPSSKRAQR